MSESENVLPPHSDRAEQAVLGCVLFEPELIRTLDLEPSDFYRAGNGLIYRVLQEIAKDTDAGAQPAIDFVTIAERLRQKEQLEDVGGESYLISLLNAVPTSQNVKEYEASVRSTAIRREILNAASRSATIAYNEEIPIGDVVAGVQEQLAGAIVAHSRDSTVTLGIAVGNVVETAEKRRELRLAGKEIPVVTTGFTGLDKFTGGLEAPNSTIVAGRPGLGKTAFLTAVALHTARQGKRVGIFNWEMTAEELARRMISTETGISVIKMRSGDLTDNELTRIYTAQGKLSELPIRISQNWEATPQSAEAACFRMLATGGLDLATFDYLQLMEWPGRTETKNVEVSNISRAIKQMADKLGIPIITASQLSRSSVYGTDKRPKLEHLRDSGSIEQDADNVWFLHRPGDYKDDNDEDNITEVLVAKHRNGPTGKVYLGWRAESVEFYDPEGAPVAYSGDPPPLGFDD